MENKIKIFLNEQPYLINDIIDVEKLLAYFNYDTYLVVLEYNGIIYSKQDWNKIFLKENDKFEIITIVGGG
uniref:Thiamine biosynthesis protein n=1 Tax=Triparma laevis TaxID=1534972 RepID=A0A0K2RW99_9STRA|nr:thiamine biosynthesis protein [Triparma laevis]BAS19098.1 thiamine biosynthesis protein [Triparma laevis]